MLLDLADRMLGEILVDLGDDPSLHVGMEGVSELRQRARRCGDDQRLGVAFAYEPLHGGGDALGKPLLLELVPVGRVEAAALIGVGSLEAASRPIGALLAAGRVLIDEDPFGGQIEELLVARVAQKQRLATVADENQGVMRNLALGDSPLLTSSECRLTKCPSWGASMPSYW